MNPDKPKSVGKHEYQYGGFEVAGDCGVCGHVHNDPIHLNLHAFMGGHDQPEFLAGESRMLHFAQMAWNGKARYTRGEGILPEDRFLLDASLFERMGQPSHIKVAITPVRPNGLPVKDC